MYNYCPNPACQSPSCISERRREAEDKLRASMGGARPRTLGDLLLEEVAAAARMASPAQRPLPAPRMLAVVDEQGAFQRTLDGERLNAVLNGEVRTVADRNGIKVAVIFQTLRINFANGSTTVEFLTPVSMKAKVVESALREALRKDFAAVMGGAK